MNFKRFTELFEKAYLEGVWSKEAEGTRGFFTAPDFPDSHAKNR
ncbi:MAG: hypothetical protein ACOC44_00130 [Promethearchaeia archaeon]